MPRITECLAARQEVLEEPAVPSVPSVPTALPSVPGCKGKCAGACIGPRCAGQSLFQKYIPYTYVLVQKGGVIIKPRLAQSVCETKCVTIDLSKFFIQNL